MFRIPALLIVTLLLFSTIPVGFAQKNAMQAQAKADALTDIDRDMKKGWWFMFGLVGSSAGSVTGCVGGCLLGSFIGTAPIHFFSDDPATNCGISNSILLGALAVPAVVFTYPHNVNPPLDRLLGKSPEYIEAYTQVYRSKTISLRKRLVTTGSLTSNLGIAGMMLLFTISDL